MTYQFDSEKKVIVYLLDPENGKYLIDPITSKCLVTISYVPYRFSDGTFIVLAQVNWSYSSFVTINSRAALFMNTGLIDPLDYSLQLIKPDGTNYAANQNYVDIGQSFFNAQKFLPGVSTQFFLSGEWLFYIFDSNEIDQAGWWQAYAETDGSSTVPIRFFVSPA